MKKISAFIIVALVTYIIPTYAYGDPETVPGEPSPQDSNSAAHYESNAFERAANSYYERDPQLAWGRTRPVPRIGEWVTTPSVRICKHAPTTEAEVRSAVEWWRSKGYEFVTITPDTIQYGCVVGEARGSILIELVSGDAYDPKYAATTSVTHSTTPDENGFVEIYSARIRLKYKTGNLPRVLEHELGHALGFAHINTYGHIMHKELLSGGWDDDGVLKE